MGTSPIPKRCPNAVAPAAFAAPTLALQYQRYLHDVELVDRAPALVQHVEYVAGGFEDPVNGRASRPRFCAISRLRLLRSDENPNDLASM
jgi:hypothetical protein